MLIRKVLLAAVACLLMVPCREGLQAQSKNKNAGALDAKMAARLAAAEDTMALLAQTVVADSILEQRQAACERLSQMFRNYLQTPNSFRYPFSRISAVSILAPPDSSFRIFSWQLFVDDSTYQYYGFIQTNQRESGVFELTDRSIDMEPPPVYETLPTDQWYGVLYYNIRQFDTPAGRKYLLMGLDAVSFFERRKLIDVLSFDPKTGIPEFGAPVFERPQKPESREHRIIVDYSAEARVRVNWDEQYQLILCDHVLPMPSPYRQGITHVPDGSYDGFKLEKGRWVFIDKVFNDSQEEVPRPVPVLNGRGKDIMGREAGGKKTSKGQ